MLIKTNKDVDAEFPIDPLTDWEERYKMEQDRLLKTYLPKELRRYRKFLKEKSGDKTKLWKAFQLSYQNDDITLPQEFKEKYKYGSGKTLMAKQRVLEGLLGLTFNQ